MSMTDPIADLLTRIRNAQQAGHPFTEVPASRIKEHIVTILQQEGFIRGYERNAQAPQDVLKVELKYGSDRRGAILGIQRESKPGCRVYVGAGEIPHVRRGLGVAIISTSKGVLADHKARREHVGGELLCTVW
jgi:small subunit ribosomal protein S8